MACDIDPLCNETGLEAHELRPINSTEELSSHKPIVEELSDWTECDPATFISNETVLIEPFEPFESTAYECIPDELSNLDLSPEKKRRNAVDFELKSVHSDVVELVTDAELNETLPSAISRLEELQKLISQDRNDALEQTILQTVSIAAPIDRPPSQNLPLREEYRELRDHLLARFPLQRPCTLLVIDAGRTTHDASWLVPLAVSIVQHVGEKTNRNLKILIVEAAGPDCGVALNLGLQCDAGLTSTLDDATKLLDIIGPTEHPQVYLLARGAGSIRQSDRQKLYEIWPTIQQEFDIVFVAAGPIESKAKKLNSSSQSATDFLPIADGVILSIELDGTPQPIAEEACRILATQSAKLLGCVVHGDAV